MAFLLRAPCPFFFSLEGALPIFLFYSFLLRAPCPSLQSFSALTRPLEIAPTEGISLSFITGQFLKWGFLRATMASMVPCCFLLTFCHIVHSIQQIQSSNKRQLSLQWQSPSLSNPLNSLNQLNLFSLDIQIKHPKCAKPSFFQTSALNSTYWLSFNRLIDLTSYILAPSYSLNLSSPPDQELSPSKVTKQGLTCISVQEKFWQI